MDEQIKTVIEEIRPVLQADGGDVEIVEIIDKTVKVRLKGACGSCPMATMTLKHGIERRLREVIDNDIVVEQVK